MAEPQHNLARERSRENILRDLLVTQTHAGKVAEAAEDFQEIPISSIKAGEPLPVNLFLPTLNRHENKIIMAQVVVAGNALRRRFIKRLHGAGFTAFYVHRSQMPEMLSHLNSLTRDLLDRSNLNLVQKAEAIYDTAAQVVTHTMRDPQNRSALAAGREYVGNVVDFMQNNPKCLKNLHEVLRLDYSLFNHSVNVGLLLISFAHKIGWEREQIIAVGLGGLFHDVGKRDIPPEILTKPGELTKEEWELVKRHPSEGMQLLRVAGNMPAETYQMIYQHHENLDGSGYPRGLSGNAISVQGQMIRIIDAYDALTSRRSHQAAAPAGGAIGVMMREMGDQVNRELLASFISFLSAVGHV